MTQFINFPDIPFFENLNEALSVHNNVDPISKNEEAFNRQYFKAVLQSTSPTIFEFLSNCMPHVLSLGFVILEENKKNESYSENRKTKTALYEGLGYLHLNSELSSRVVIPVLDFKDEYKANTQEHAAFFVPPKTITRHRAGIILDCIEGNVFLKTCIEQCRLSGGKCIANTCVDDGCYKSTVTSSNHGWVDTCICSKGS